ncbi:unnamed protein product, partial [Vitis vinifera]
MLVSITCLSGLTYDSKPSLDSKMDGQDSDDPKQSTADMTAFVQNLLQQMQSRFQAMSDSIVTKNILFFWLVLFCDLNVYGRTMP